MGDAFLDAARIRASTFIRYVEVHDSIGSTNDRATELAANPSIALPALVVARQQTAGRGRGAHTWWSADGALTFTVVLDPSAFEVQSSKWPQVSLATAVAVCDALGQELTDANEGGWGSSAAHAPARQGAAKPPHAAEDQRASSRLQVKWPNDVFLDDTKVCGILITSPGVASVGERLVIGIGINVNNSWRGAPSELGAIGTALCDASGKHHELDAVLTRTLRAIEDRIRQLATGDPRLPLAWQRLSWLTGNSVTVHDGDRATTGLCLGIDSDGSLLVENAGEIQRVWSGSVAVLED
jgi:BirA family biotin operon repressor/biotin-[acetyl-CoA-carboxylase] ligase